MMPRISKLGAKMFRCLGRQLMRTALSLREVLALRFLITPVPPALTVADMADVAAAAHTFSPMAYLKSAFYWADERKFRPRSFPIPMLALVLYDG